MFRLRQKIVCIELYKTPLNTWCDSVACTSREDKRDIAIESDLHVCVNNYITIYFSNRLVLLVLKQSKIVPFLWLMNAFIDFYEYCLKFFNFMMQKNSMVETQSLNQRNKKDTQRKKTQSQKPPKNKDRTMVCSYKRQTQHNKKKTRNVTIIISTTNIKHNNRTITCKKTPNNNNRTTSTTT